ncbi:nitric oxide synthase-interacting protein [Tremella mesenterica]|uniref:Nitric oxide synthase-interacting protein n=1 Tax=Tremella mesenterica TaxID=5217 RepID=A0A4Q1BU69_TREME|nr:nitric oxide synthase-interacting protein [Tremella mesenterica]
MSPSLLLFSHFKYITSHSTSWFAHVSFLPTFLITSDDGEICITKLLDAKNNTTQANLTYYERSLLRAPNAARRIGANSFKPLDACNLCLSTAISPVACGKGHLYCRECAIADLLTQKASIETQKRDMERWEENEARERETARLRARERVVADFERGMGLAGPSGRTTTDIRGSEVRSVGEGRKTMEELTKEAEERAMKMIENEQAEIRKAKLAAFWLPSLAPEAKLGPIKDIKLQTLCQVGGKGHGHPFS